jgi:hypothetical protein
VSLPAHVPQSSGCRPWVLGVCGACAGCAHERACQYLSLCAVLGFLGCAVRARVVPTSVHVNVCLCVSECRCALDTSRAVAMQPSSLVWRLCRGMRGCTTVTRGYRLCSALFCGVPFCAPSSLSRSLSLSPFHTDRTRTTHARTHTYAHTHNTRTHIRPCPHMHTQTQGNPVDVLALCDGSLVRAAVELAQRWTTNQGV